MTYYSHEICVACRAIFWLHPSDTKPPLLCGDCHKSAVNAQQIAKFKENND